MGLALDEPDENDETQEVSGYLFCIEKKILDQIKSVYLDFDVVDFKIYTERTLRIFGGC